MCMFLCNTSFNFNNTYKHLSGPLGLYVVSCLNGFLWRRGIHETLYFYISYKVIKIEKKRRNQETSNVGAWSIRQPASPNRVRCNMVPRKVYNMYQGQTVHRKSFINCLRVIMRRVHTKSQISTCPVVAYHQDVQTKMNSYSISTLNKSKGRRV